MGFFYMSILSVLPLGIAYGMLALIFWGVAWATRGVRWRRPILGTLGVVFLLLPISEELWIARNFGQACKEAGTFIYKKVRVDGFYDETGIGSLALVQSGTYRFIESRTEKGFSRLTRGDPTFMQEAMVRFAKESHAKDVSNRDVIRVRMDDHSEALVFPKRRQSWRITRLDRPTARYHFKFEDRGVEVTHKVIKSGSVVIDSETNERIARYVSFGRAPAWFFVGLDVPAFACDSPGEWPLTKGSSLIYREALLGISQD